MQEEQNENLNNTPNEPESPSKNNILEPYYEYERKEDEEMGSIYE